MNSTMYEKREREKLKSTNLRKQKKQERKGGG